MSDVFDLKPAGANLWRADADPRYWNAVGPWGGWTAGVLLQAVLEEEHAAGAPVAMTLNLMSGFEQAPVELATRIMRKGRSLEFWNVELSQGGAVCAQAMITLAQRRATEHFLEMPMPPAPMPEEIEAPPPSPPQQGNRLAFGAMYERRGAKGFPPTGDGDTESISWTRHVGPVKMDHVQLAMIADLFPPRIFYKGLGFRPTATVSMNVYFHATAEEIDAVGDDYVLAQAAARRGGGGFNDQLGALWRRDGVLLATTEQLIWFK